MTHPLSDLAWRTWDEGNLRLGMAQLQDCLAIFRQLGAQGSLASTLGALTEMAWTMGDFEGAAEAAQARYELERTGDFDSESDFGLFTRAKLNLAQGHLDLARRQLEAALQFKGDATAAHRKADIHAELGRVANYAGLADEAEAHFATSRRWSALTDPFPPRDSDVLLGLGHAACLRGEFARASELFRDSLSLARERQPAVPARLEGLAWAAWGQGDYPQAVRWLAAAEHRRRAMGAPVPPVERPRYDEMCGALKAALGDGAFEQAWADGATMPI